MAGVGGRAEGSLRTRTRELMRSEVVRVAVELFVAHGFDAVSTTQIAEVAGISPRSFFRYFGSKEDVLLGSMRDAGLRVRDALHARPVDEGGWEALEHAFGVLVEEPVYPREHLAAVARILVETPSIRSRDLQKYQEWEALLLPDVERRVARSRQASVDSVKDDAAAVLAAALAVLRVATQQWLAEGASSDPGRLMRRLASSVRTLD